MPCRPRLLPLLLLGSLATGCGGDSAPPTKIEGPFAQVFASRVVSFSLAADKLQVVCRPKPGLKEFEFEAATTSGATSGNFLRFTLKDYTGPKDYEIEYDASKPQHKMEVGFPADPPQAKGYRYDFLQFSRVDLNEIYRSHCDLSIGAEELSDRTRYTGTVSCTMLWANFDSLDHSTGVLNSFADLVAKFQCEF